MNLAGPSRVPPFRLLAPRERAVSTYEDDLLRFLRELSFNDMLHIQTYSTHRTRAGDPLSDYDIAMNDLLQQTFALAIFDQDRVLAQRINTGGDAGFDQALVQIQDAVPQTSANEGVAPSSPTGNDCVVCQKPIHGAEIRAPCGDYYGIDCVTDLFQSATRDETLFPPRCCGQNITFTQVQPHLSQELIATFQQKQVEFSTLRRVYCSSPTCSHFLGPLSEDTDHVYTCPVPECATQTCAKCRGNYDVDGMHDCAPDVGITQVLELGRATGWARCPGCSQMIERRLGCNHMTCRCRTEFCYPCGARWKTCSCPQSGVDPINAHNQERWFFAAAEERVDPRLWVDQQPGAQRDVRHATQRPGPVPVAAVPANRTPVGVLGIRRDVRHATRRVLGPVPPTVPANRAPVGGWGARPPAPAPRPAPAPTPARPRAPARPPAVEARHPQPTPTRTPPASGSTLTRRGAIYMGGRSRSSAASPAASTSASGSGSGSRPRSTRASTSTTPSMRTLPERPRVVRWRY